MSEQPAFVPGRVAGQRLSARTHQALRQGVARWRLQQARSRSQSGTPLSQNAEILVSLPRRTFAERPQDTFELPVPQSQQFKTYRWKALGRLWVWFNMLAYFFLGTVWDRLRGRNTEARRAVRLRLTFERAGGTFIKFAQQLSMRIDLLPWAYTVELSRLLDQVPPFPLEQALAVLERSLGRPWDQVFAILDPEPIGSASIANVYQAELMGGERVAVKVRRPGIGETFMADFKVFDWLLDLAEFLTLVRPGTTQNLRREFKATLLEELDFVQEARFQDMFRYRARKSGKKFFSAPKVYFEYCSPEVIVQRYSEGIWLWEIMAGVEQHNQEALARMRALNIDPHKVAERLLWVNYWGMQENLIFHADPHPANVIVGQNSRLTFVDFGSCGSFNWEQRAGLEMTAIGSANNDAEMMARGTLKLFEPLPPLDVKALHQQAEAEYTRVLTVFRSNLAHSAWWERTSVRQWMSFFKFARQHHIPVMIHTLRMIRATLLYDTIAVRLSKDVDRFAAYLKFRRYRESQARQRLMKGARQQLHHGLDSEWFVRLEQASRAGERLLYRAQGLLGSPVFNFGSLVGKWFFALAHLIRLAGQVTIVTLLAVLFAAVLSLLHAQALDMPALVQQVASSWLYWAVLLILFLTHLRQALFR
ncbi:MAG: AarF/ABC1/UbiB kinase family protein, partial [Anaerolineales bacterium]|nr:AarF/ABC1/UbiB kinase family protein [Anaerolineales bacterium]